MCQETKYANKFNVAANNVEMVINFIQQQPVFAEDGTITVEEAIVSKIVMPLPSAVDLFNSISNCLTNQAQQGAENGVVENAE